MRTTRGGFTSPPLNPLPFAQEALKSEIGESADALVAFLEAAPAMLGTDPSRACLLGFSQGASIGW